MIKATEKFYWPQRKSAAISLTFDDARPSQIDNGLPLLDKYGIKATFYVLASPPFDNVKKRLFQWKQAVSNGHEMGNHTLTHPCSGNFSWSRENALEDYTLEKMSKEIDNANNTIEKLIGIRPVTFAYPAGQKFVGRGKTLRSYVPLISEKFIVGRGWHDEGTNDPAFCDLAQVFGIELDNLEFKDVEPLLEVAKSQGHWLVFCGHEVGTPNPQTTYLSTLEAVCKYVTDPSNKIWIDTVKGVGNYIIKKTGID